MFSITEHSVTSKLNQYVQFIGLNPSTADEFQDDPTIRRCINFAKSWGYGAFCMTNIFAWRDTDPEGMKKVEAPIGVENCKHILSVAKDAGIVIAAWGKHGSHMGRGKRIIEIFDIAGIKLHCLKKNDDGSPAHPLYLKSTLTPIPYP